MPAITISMPVMFRRVRVSPSRIKEKRAVKRGIVFVKGLTLAIPICLTDQAKSMKAPHEAKSASSATGRNDLRVWGVEKSFSDL